MPPSRAEAPDIVVRPQPMRLTRYNDLIVGTDRDLIDGRWELMQNSVVAFRRRGLEEEIFVKGPVIAAEPYALVFSVTQKQHNQAAVTRTMRLAGRGQIGAQNRLQFSLDSESGQGDSLVFEGKWEIGKSNGIVYRLGKSKSKAGGRVQVITFNGYWDLASANRLTYSLGGTSDNGVSELRFRGSFQTPSILAKKGEIRYQIGVEGVNRGKTVFTLFGKWKFSDKLGLMFEMDYPQKRRHSLVFGIEWNPGLAAHASIQLVSRTREPLGVKLVLTQSLKRDIESFISVQKTSAETRLEAGIRFNW